MPKSLNVGFLMTPGMLTTGTAYPYEMWVAALDHSRARRLPTTGSLSLIGVSDDKVTGQLPLRADCFLADCHSLDVLYLPALWRNPKIVLRSVEKEFLPWIKTLAGAGTKIAAVGTGVCLLAASGLLNNRPATTHWYYFEQFKRSYPEVDLKSEFFITQSDSLYCAASINSLADVTVHLIELLVGLEPALHVERNFSHEIRRGYKNQRFSVGGDAPSTDEVVAEALAWITENVGSNQSISFLADKLGVSRRTLDRRFKIATGTSVRAYWQKNKMRLAQELLGESDLPIGEVAWRVGYQDGGYFSYLFRREMSVTPHEYRKTVRAKLFNESS